VPEPELTESLWIRLVPRLDLQRLCSDGQVAGSVFGLLAQQIFQELVDWKWLEKVSLESHQAAAAGMLLQRVDIRCFLWVARGEVLPIPAELRSDSVGEFIYIFLFITLTNTMHGLKRLKTYELPYFFGMNIDKSHLSLL